MSPSEFQRLLAASAELGSLFSQGLVYIGGIAVYFHAINSAEAKALAEATHDGDFFISLTDYQDLRDIEEVVPNRRLSRAQIIKHGFEFDVYVERQATLLVPYDEVVARSVAYGDVRVACLEHLFVLKLEAYRDRRGSAKGQKDARDLIRIAMVAGPMFDATQVAPYLSDEHLALLDGLKKSAETVALAGGNAVLAKKLRARFAALLDGVVLASEGGGQESRSRSDGESG